MLKKEQFSDETLIGLMYEASREGISYWRPGDLKPVKHIVGTYAWRKISAAGMERRAGNLFRYIASELGLVESGKDVNRNMLYGLKAKE